MKTPKILVRMLVALALLTATSCIYASQSNRLATGVSSGHAHNDYLHKRPLFDAMENGFNSVEADVFAENNDLLLGHDRSQLRPERNLVTLYLEPLAERLRSSGDRIHKNRGTFFLLIDFKTNGEKTYNLLKEQLKPYRAMLTEFSDTATMTNAITVVISGNCPRSIIAGEARRWVACDGRVSDLDGKPNKHLIPWISDNWRSHFKWNGEGALPTPEQSKLKSLVQKAHTNGQAVRFWAAPDTPAAWATQMEAGVDFINSDRLEALGRFLTIH